MAEMLITETIHLLFKALQAIPQTALQFLRPLLFQQIRQTFAASSGSSGGGGGGGGGMASLAMLAAAKGGLIKNGYLQRYAPGGYIAPMPLVVNPSEPQSFVGKWMNSNVGASSGPNVQATANLAQDPNQLSKSVPKGSKSNPASGATSMQGNDGTEFGGSDIGGLWSLWFRRRFNKQVIH